MNRPKKVFFISVKYYLFIISACVISGVSFLSCKEKTRPEEKVIVEVPEKMDDKVKGLI